MKSPLANVKYIKRLWTLYRAGEQASNVHDLAVSISGMRAYRCALVDAGAMEAASLRDYCGLEDELLERYCDKGGKISALNELTLLIRTY